MVNSNNMPLSDGELQSALDIVNKGLLGHSAAKIKSVREVMAKYQDVSLAASLALENINRYFDDQGLSIVKVDLASMRNFKIVDDFFKTHPLYGTDGVAKYPQLQGLSALFDDPQDAQDALELAQMQTQWELAVDNQFKKMTPAQKYQAIINSLASNAQKNQLIMLDQKLVEQLLKENPQLDQEQARAQLPQIRTRFEALHQSYADYMQAAQANRNAEIPQQLKISHEAAIKSLAMATSVFKQKCGMVSRKNALSRFFNKISAFDKKMLKKHPLLWGIGRSAVIVGSIGIAAGSAGIALYACHKAYRVIDRSYREFRAEQKDKTYLKYLCHHPQEFVKVSVQLANAAVSSVFAGMDVAMRGLSAVGVSGSLLAAGHPQWANPVMLSKQFMMNRAVSRGIISISGGLSVSTIQSLNLHQAKRNGASAKQIKQMRRQAVFSALGGVVGAAASVTAVEFVDHFRHSGILNSRPEPVSVPKPVAVLPLKHSLNAHYWGRLNHQGLSLPKMQHISGHNNVSVLDSTIHAPSAPQASAVSAGTNHLMSTHRDSTSILTKPTHDVTAKKNLAAEVIHHKPAVHTTVQEVTHKPSPATTATVHAHQSESLRQETRLHNMEAGKPLPNRQGASATAKVIRTEKPVQTVQYNHSDEPKNAPLHKPVHPEAVSNKSHLNHTAEQKLPQQSQTTPIVQKPTPSAKPVSTETKWQPVAKTTDHNLDAVHEKSSAVVPEKTLQEKPTMAVSEKTVTPHQEQPTAPVRDFYKVEAGDEKVLVKAKQAAKQAFQNYQKQQQAVDQYSAELAKLSALPENDLKHLQAVENHAKALKTMLDAKQQHQLAFTNLGRYQLQHDLSVAEKNLNVVNDQIKKFNLLENQKLKIENQLQSKGLQNNQAPKLTDVLPQDQKNSAVYKSTASQNVARYLKITQLEKEKAALEAVQTKLGSHDSLLEKQATLKTKIASLQDQIKNKNFTASVTEAQQPTGQPETNASLTPSTKKLTVEPQPTEQASDDFKETPQKFAAVIAPDLQTAEDFKPLLTLPSTYIMAENNGLKEIHAMDENGYFSTLQEIKLAGSNQISYQLILPEDHYLSDPAMNPQLRTALQQSYTRAVLAHIKNGDYQKVSLMASGSVEQAVDQPTAHIQTEKDPYRIEAGDKKSLIKAKTAAREAYRQLQKAQETNRLAYKDVLINRSKGEGDLTYLRAVEKQAQALNDMLDAKEHKIETDVKLYGYQLQHDIKTGEQKLDLLEKQLKEVGKLDKKLEQVKAVIEKNGLKENQTPNLTQNIDQDKKLGQAYETTASENLAKAQRDAELRLQQQQLENQIKNLGGKEFLEKQKSDLSNQIHRLESELKQLKKTGSLPLKQNVMPPAESVNEDVAVPPVIEDKTSVLKDKVEPKTKETTQHTSAPTNKTNSFRTVQFRPSAQRTA